MSTQFLGIVVLERFLAAERYLQSHHEPSSTSAGPSKGAGQAAPSVRNAGGHPDTSGKLR